MSDTELLDGAAKSNNDEENNAVLAATSDNPYTFSSDDRAAIDEDSAKLISRSPKPVVTKLQTSKNVTDGILKLQSIKEPNIDKYRDQTPDNIVKFCSDDSGTLISPETKETCDNDEVSLKKYMNTDILAKNLPNEAIASVTSTGSSKEVENYQERLANEAISVTAYKKTLIDNASDSDMELRWTDNEDDQLGCPPLSDDALKLLDKELCITDAGTETEELAKNIVSDKDIESTDQNIQKVTNQVVDMADEVVQKLTNKEFKKVDVKIHNVMEKSDEKIVKNVQKVKDPDVETISQDKVVENPTKIDQLFCPPLSDNTLELLDKELCITDVGIDTKEPSENINKVADLDIDENSQKVTDQDVKLANENAEKVMDQDLKKLNAIFHKAVDQTNEKVVEHVQKVKGQDIETICQDKVLENQSKTDQLFCPPLSDNALELLDKELCISDVGIDAKQPSKNIYKVAENSSKVTDPDIEMPDEIPQKVMDQSLEKLDTKIHKVINQNVEKNDEYVHKLKDQDIETIKQNEIVENTNITVDYNKSETEITESDFQPCIDGALKLLDEELEIDGGEKSIDKGFDKTVKELQQLLDQDDVTVQRNSKAVEEQTKSIVSHPEKINVSEKNKNQALQPMTTSEMEEIPSITEINTVPLELKLEEDHVIKEEVVKDSTIPISMSEYGNDSNIFKKGNDQNCSTKHNTKAGGGDDHMDGNNTESIPKRLTETVGSFLNKKSQEVVEDIAEPILGPNKDDNNITKDCNDHVIDESDTIKVAIKQIKSMDFDIKEIVEDVNKSIVAPSDGDDSIISIESNILHKDITENVAKRQTDTVDYVINKEVVKDVAEPKQAPNEGDGSTISIESNIVQHKDGNDTENFVKREKPSIDYVIKKVVIEDIMDTMSVPNEQVADENAKESKDHIIAENAANIVIPISMPKNVDDDNITKDDGGKSANIPIINEEKSDVTIENDDQFMTSNEINISIKINTDHRIMRPDVMLHIPTQEFDFGDDFEETSEKLDKQALSDRIDKDNSNMTATVTEIVNQLAKDIDEETNTESNRLTDEYKTESILKIKNLEKNDSNTTQTKDEQSEKVTVEDAMEKMFSETTDKVGDMLKNVALKPLEKDIYYLEKTSEQDKTTSVEKQQEIDVQPSTSDALKMTCDTVEEVHEVDTLGLLAESSRVMDDDDDDDQMEPEEDEGADGDDDDDDDFDPDGEESSNQTAEHSEESNPAHSELDIHEDGIDIVEADVIGLVSDSNDADDGFQTLLGDAADITVEENEPVGIALAEDKETVAKDDQIKDSKEDSKEDAAKESNASEAKKPTTERRSSILSELLMKKDDNDIPQPAASTIPPNKLNAFDITKAKNLLNIVDLEESSSEDDGENKKSKQTPSRSATVQLEKVVESMRKSADSTEGANKKELSKEDKDKPKVGEVFNLDSDDDDKAIMQNAIDKPVENQCINHNCTSDGFVPFYLADRVSIAYYGAARRRRRAVCQHCLDIVNSRNQGLLSGIKDLRPLMSLRMARPTQQLLEISDSDSEGEDDPIGEGGAKLIEDQLTNLINETWVKYKMDDRLKETEDYLEAELEKMQKQSEEIDQLLKTCQKATDKLRVDFYSGFEPQRQELAALSVHDTPIASYACLEAQEETKANETPPLNMRYPKRRSSSAIETTAKKQALPDSDGKKVTRSSSLLADQNKQEEDKDISVVRLSAESAPAELPPPGDIVRAPVQVGVQVYAMKNYYGAWLKGRVVEVLAKTPDQYTQCRVRFEHKVKNPCKLLTARSIAYTEPCEVRMTIGTRVIALSRNSENANKRGSFYYSGIIAEIPNPVNSYRYLVFFDDGYVQYVHHQHTRLVYESSALVWEEVHPYSRDFVCNYLLKYPERPMVRMHQGQSLVVEWNGKWWDTKVLKVDAALVKVFFPNGRQEWIYRGATRLQPLFTEFQAASRGDRARLPRSTKASTKTNMPYVEYTRSDGQMNKNEIRESEELRRQRSVAKKSTALAPIPGIAPGVTETLVSRVVFYTPKNSVRPYKMVPHTCGPQCNRNDLIPLKELRTYNPLSKPLLSGWERQIVRHKYFREIMYRAPCGRRLRSMPELHRYLRAVRSEMSVDLFDFGINTHCLAEFVLNKSNVQKKDLSHGKENVPVPCVNYYNHSLPEFCSYNTERTPTAGVPLNLDPEFLCGCDCEDDCVDKTKCACWKMTLEGARTIGIEGSNIGYEYRRLPEPLPSGIYECNSRCKCKSTCLNRVVQNPLQLKLQVFKTLNRGWGIRALNDVPKGSFLCIYAGNLLTDATANLDGLNEGDEYLAELDYIEVVEAMKDGYEEDIPVKIKRLDKKESKKSESESESETSESEEEQRPDKNDIDDGDFQPGYLAFGLTEFNKRLRRRDKTKKNMGEEETKEEKEEQEEKETSKKEEDEECITISDDEEVRVSQREPSRFTAQEGMTDSKVISKYRSIRSYFGKDEACYIMDAKVQGNIGRYLNHSCSPNVFVQNVFVDTHDPRFPWVSFFALHHIKAGTELTWNYNYDVGSVPGKVLYCFCGAPNCRGRLL